MSWMANLYETYQNAMASDDIGESQKPMPICHTLQNAHIHIVLNGNGDFLRAEVLTKTQIPLPATEKSAGRSSGLEPHPLADKIQYVAADYPFFGGVKKSGFELYKDLLERWCKSDFSHPSVIAVYKYIQKKCVISDLVEHGIMFIQDNKLLTQWIDDNEPADIFKVLPKDNKGTEQGSALVCWSVEIPNEKHTKTWTDLSLQQSWIDFDAQNDGDLDLCMVKGEQATIAVNHPAKIRHTGDKAKLISANDESGFTFRGRFNTAKEASAISFDVTQKAHNALRWLITRQANKSSDDLVYVTWANSGKKVPDPQADSWDLFECEINAEVDHRKDLGKTYATKFNHYLDGFLACNRGDLDANEMISIIGVDSATPGRMGVTYYREVIAQEFIDELKKWHIDFQWPQRRKDPIDETKTIWVNGAPSLYRILDAVYGDILKSTKTLKKNLVSRLLPCIVEGGNVPTDIVNSAVNRVTNRVAYKSEQAWLWEQNLGVACALVKGTSKRNKKISKEYKMALEETYTGRDYLYGRLLAVAERTERVALSIHDSSRLTTAERYMQRFSVRPSSTWLNISQALTPYQQRLNAQSPPLQELQEALNDLVSQITDMFLIDNFGSDKKLGNEFLLGFHSQRLWLKQHKVCNGQWVSIEEENNNS